MLAPAVQQAPTSTGLRPLEAQLRSWRTAGNFEYDANPRDVERLFDRFGPIERLDMKTGEHASLITSGVAPTGLCSACVCVPCSFSTHGVQQPVVSLCSCSHFL